MSDLFIVKLRNKRIVYVRTETGRFFDITRSKPITDNKYGINYNGLLRNAKPVLAEHVADQLAACSPDEYEQLRITKGKATSKRKRRQEVVRV